MLTSLCRYLRNFMKNKTSSVTKTYYVAQIHYRTLAIKPTSMSIVYARVCRVDRMPLTKSGPNPQMIPVYGLTVSHAFTTQVCPPKDTAHFALIAIIKNHINQEARVTIVFTFYVICIRK